MKRYIPVSLLLFLFAVAFAADELIPYAILNESELGSTKLSLDIEVPLIEERLPTAEELGAVSQHLLKQSSKHDRTFVSFYLPGMEVGAGAYATAHHDPEMEVKIQKFMLFAYPEYEEYAE